MANSSSTPVIDTASTTGAVLPISYGWVWVTGRRGSYYMLQNTGSKDLDYTRVGRWSLGEGEWDGNAELWINDDLTWTSEYDDPTQFHFHRGSDATIGAGLDPSSSGPDQGVDSFFSSLPSAVQPLAFSRVAYYMIKRKQAIKNQTNTHQDDASQWTDIAPVGLWRSMRCRLFNADGKMTGYAFTTNPAWHFVDVLLRRKIYPEYNIDPVSGPGDISDAARARFDWEPIYEAATYFDGFLANGRRRFRGNYTFSSQTTLAGICEVILRTCRSFQREYAGKIGLFCDKPRSSVFMISREHVMAGSLAPSDKQTSAAGNCMVGKFRDILIPVAAQIASIDCPDHKNPVVTTVSSHPLDAGDRVHIGGTGTIYDGRWKVDSVPDGDSVTTLSLLSKGANYPVSVTSGGYIGLLYSRFKERAPRFSHRANQLARGMVGLGLERQLNEVPTEYDFVTNTFDQVSRICRYERDRSLGPDQTPYVTPKVLSLVIPMFSIDAAGSGRSAMQIQPGDRISINDKASYRYAGDYEVLDSADRYPSVSASNDGFELSMDATGGEIELELGPYSNDVYYDETDVASAGWSNVPGSDPDSDSTATSIPLEGEGNFIFISGQLATGSQFQLPSAGYPASNILAWASAASAAIQYHSAHTIQLCSTDESRLLTLIYDDNEGNRWGGDVAFGAVSWLSSDAITVSGSMSWIELTLLGGEKILFGQGILADGASVTLPTGYSADKMFALAFVHDQYPNGNIMHLVGAYVDDSQVVHVVTSDNVGNIWHGNASVLVFAWKNNMGTVVTEAVSVGSVGGGGSDAVLNGNWMRCLLSDGSTFGVGCAKDLANGATLALPVSAQTNASIQLLPGSHKGTYVDGAVHAQGVGACYVDSDYVAHITFNNGSGVVWPGTMDVFALYTTPATTVVTVSPANVRILIGLTHIFTAVVSYQTDQSVTWSVDGIAGGNSTVGTIDASGLYTAPATAGEHTITATSVADSSKSGSGTAVVYDGPVAG